MWNQQQQQQSAQGYSQQTRPQGYQQFPQQGQVQPQTAQLTQQQRLQQALQSVTQLQQGQGQLPSQYQSLQGQQPAQQYQQQTRAQQYQPTTVSSQYPATSQFQQPPSQQQYQQPQQYQQSSQAQQYQAGAPSQQQPPYSQQQSQPQFGATGQKQGDYGQVSSQQSATSLFNQAFQAPAAPAQSTTQARTGYDYGSGGFQQAAPTAPASTTQGYSFPTARQPGPTSPAQAPQSQQQAQQATSTQQLQQLLTQRLLQEQQQNLLQQLSRLDPAILQQAGAVMSAQQQQQQPQQQPPVGGFAGRQQQPPATTAFGQQPQQRLQQPQQPGFQARPGASAGGSQDYAYRGTGFSSGRTDRPSVGSVPSSSASGFSRAGDFGRGGFSRNEPAAIGARPSGRPDRPGTGFSGPVSGRSAPVAPVSSPLGSAGSSRPRDFARSRADSPVRAPGGSRLAPARRERGSSREKDVVRRDDSSRDSKKRRPSPRRDEHRKKSRSISVERDRSSERDQKKYQFKLSPFPFAQQVRGYLDIKRRYPRLHVSQDFTHVVCNWTQAGAGQPVVDISRPVKVLCEALSKGDATEETQGEIHQVAGVRYFAKAILLSGSDSTSSSMHLSHLLKFLVCKRKRERSELLCVGGPWSSALDGSDPDDPNSPALINTAIRWTKEQTQIDLSTSTQWVRFMEIYYDRPETTTSPRCTDVVVFYIPDASAAIPSMKDFTTQWKEVEKAKSEVLKKEGPASGKAKESAKDDDKTAGSKGTEDKAAGSKGAEEKAVVSKGTEDKEVESKEKQKKQKEEADKAKTKMPTKPCLLAVTRSAKEVKMRAMMLSLDGLLDYDESDRYEATFEASLFGELFHEMLQQEFGHQILRALLAVPKARRSPSPEPEPSDKSSRKRQREQSNSPSANPKKLKSTELKQGDGSTSESSSVTLVANGASPEASEKPQESTPPAGDTLHSDQRNEEHEHFAQEGGLAAEEHPAAMDIETGHDTMPTGVDMPLQTEEVPHEIEEQHHESTGMREEPLLGSIGDGVQEGRAVEERPSTDNTAEKTAMMEGEGLPEHPPVIKEDGTVPEITANVPQGPPPLVDGESVAAQADTPPAAESKDQNRPVKQEGGEQKPGTEDKDRIRAAKEAKRLAEEKEKEMKNQVARSELTRAFRYFDRNGVGYLKNEDVEALLHCLDDRLSRRFVHSLVNNASDIHQRKLFYSSLIEKLLKLGYPLPAVPLHDH